jgi:hypothetical protein
VRRPYEDDGSLEFPHKRRVEWLLVDPWPMPQPEGLRTTAWELGKSAIIFPRRIGVAEDAEWVSLMLAHDRSQERDLLLDVRQHERRIELEAR